MSGGRPPEELDFPVAPVDPGGSRGRGIRVAAAGAIIVGALVLAGVGLGQAFPTTPDEPVLVLPTPPTVPLATTAPSEARTPSVAPSFQPTVLSRRLGRSDFITGVLDGSLDGFVVYLDGELQAWCADDVGADCASPTLHAIGLPLEVVPAEVASSSTSSAPDNAVPVLRVNGATLEYVGTLLTHPDGSPTLGALSAEVDAADAADPDAPAADLRDAAGWLVTRSPCYSPERIGPGCIAGAFLADVEPLLDGTRTSDAGQRVGIVEGAIGIDAEALVMPGPFLVREVASPVLGGPRWEIVARYDPARSVRLTVR